MKSINKYIFIALAILTFSGCNEYLDINKDPNVLSDAPAAKVLLPSAELKIANNLMGWDFGFAGGFWSQYWTQSYTASQFKTLCEYNPVSFGTAYNDLTAGALLDLSAIKTMTASSASTTGYYFISEALSIYTWQIMTDVWGDIPYSEALKGSEGVVSPKFDKGQDIYADLLLRVEKLISTDISNASIDAKYDFLFAGNMTSWMEFAKSLKLKLMIRLSETGSYDNSKLISFIESSNFISKSAKISGSVWADNQEGKRHPMREFEEGQALYLSTNVIGCKTFIDYLKNNSDPRINTLFTAPSAGHKGAFFGDFDSKFDSDKNGTTDDKEVYSKALFTATQDLIVMSMWEIDFYIAEVYARAGNHVKAKLYYEEGVNESLKQHGITNSSILTTGYATWVDGTLDSELKQIAMQKWVANANYQHIESFLERNRLKYPAVNEIDIKLDRNGAFLNFPVGDLTLSVNGRAKTNGLLPSSPVYPDAVLTRNTNAPAQKVDLLVKVWWDKKAGK